MSINVCPIAVVHAPLDHVWEFLSEPKNFALWWDAQTQGIIPDGRAQAGQKILAKTVEMGKSWDLTVTVNDVDESKHHIDLTTALPFGITVYNHITCTALKDGNTQVSFG
jgi:ligand-binding SRPBCC domain-containing protein